MPIRTTGFRIARILGIPIYLDASWLLIFGWITYQLSKIVLPQMHSKWTPTQYWSVGVLTSLLFFASVLFHELAHSMVALYYKIPVHSITLFIFGGIARIGKEPSKPIQEFNIAIAGPLASFFLAGLYRLGNHQGFFPRHADCGVERQGGCLCADGHRRLRGFLQK